MTGKERMLAAIKGEPVDRVPIWLREGFDFHLPIPDKDHFTIGWRAEPEYVELWEYARDYCDLRIGWSPGGLFNRTLNVPSHVIEATSEMVDENTRRTHITVHTPDGDLTGIRQTYRGESTSWTVKFPVENMEDLEKLRRVPFEVAPVSYANYEKTKDLVGDRGVLCLGVSSPWVVFATCMSFELALIWSLTESRMVHEILGEITDRILAGLKAIFARPVETMVNMGGSEQCTPPMMSPDAYAEFVSPYESRIVEFLKLNDVPANCHCHGRISTALPEMVKSGFVSTDPVEPPFLGGDGDVTASEAREIVGDRLTLCGNLQFDELERSTPDQIRERVREIMDTGKNRLVLGASAGPTSRMSPSMIANFRAWVEEAVSYGRIAN